MTVSFITATNVVLNAVITAKVQHFHNAIGSLWKLEYRQNIIKVKYKYI